jgi:hypothetical protein
MILQGRQYSKAISIKPFFFVFWFYREGREALENQPDSRESRPLIASQDKIDGRQAAGFW